MKLLAPILALLFCAGVTLAQPATQPTFSQQLATVVAQAQAVAAAADAKVAAQQQQIVTLTATVARMTAAMQEPATQPMATLPAGDLTAAVNGLAAGEHIELTAAATYTVSACNISGNGCKLRCADLSHPAILILNGTISVTGSNVEISGLSVSSAAGGGWRQALQWTGKSPNFHDCSFDRVTTIIKAQGADGYFIANIKSARQTGGDLYFIASSNGLISHCSNLGMSSPASEHVVRYDVNDLVTKGSAGWRPQNNVIDECDFCNDSTSNKEVIAGRELDGLTVRNTIIRGWMRGGQDTTDSSVHVTGLVIDHCTFPVALPAFTLLDIKNGCTATVTNTTFGPAGGFAARQTMIRCGNHSTLTVSGNVVLSSIGAAVGPLVGTDAGAVVRDDGTTVYK